MGKFYVTVDLPNTSYLISGVAFVDDDYEGDHGIRKISSDPVDEDTAATFALIPGFASFDADAPAPVVLDANGVPKKGRGRPKKVVEPVVYPDTAAMIAAGYKDDALKNASDFGTPAADAAVAAKAASDQAVTDAAAKEAAEKAAADKIIADAAAAKELAEKAAEKPAPEPAV